MALTVVLVEERELLLETLTLVETQLLDKVITEVTVQLQDTVSEQEVEVQVLQEEIILLLTQLKVTVVLGLAHQ